MTAATSRQSAAVNRNRFIESPPFIEALGYRDAHEGRFVVIFNDSSGGLRVKRRLYRRDRAAVDRIHE